MAGHSKWANIQHRKGAQDKKRSKIFTRLIRELTVAARAGGSDPDANPRLRLAIQNANNANMPKDTLTRAVKRGAGELDGVNSEEVIYEGYGPAGVAILVECFTDNRNRTVADVRHAFAKHGGNLGTAGSVSYLFNTTGIIHFAEGANEEKIMELALEHGADDVEVNEDTSIDVYVAPDQFEALLVAFNDQGLQPEEASVSKVASTEAMIDDKDAAEKMLKLVDVLEELDDVQAVASNANIPDEILNELD